MIGGYNLRRRKATNGPVNTSTSPEPPKKKKKIKTSAEPVEKKKTSAEPVEKKKTSAEPVEKKKTLKTSPEPVEKKTLKTTAEPVEKKKRTTKAPAEPVVKKEKLKTPTEPVAKKEELKASPEPVVATHDVARSQLVFGSDSCGELGLGRIGIAKKLPIRVPIKEPVKRVVCGPMHTLTLREDGKVYSYGCNDEGALGRVTDGDEDLESTPTIVPIDGVVIKITAGDSHSAALTDDQQVFIWGNFRDEHGSIGLTPGSDGKATYQPVQVLPDKKLQDIASGSNHMLLLDTDGVVYSFGVGAQGQLGRLGPDQVAKDGNSCSIDGDNRKLFLAPQQVCLKGVDPNRPFICDAVFAGNFSSFATNTDKKKNRLAGWGLNNYFQLGYKGLKGQLVQHYPKRATFTCSTSMAQVACGQHHTLFLTKTGRVYAAGRHEYGMLGLGKVSQEVCPAKPVEGLGNSTINISAGINTSFAVSKEGKLYAWGMGGINLGLQNEEDLIKPAEVKSFGGSRVLSVSAGGSFTAVVVES